MANSGHYTQDEAVKKLALKREDIANLVREGRIREFRIDGQVKYKKEEIDALAEEINPSLGVGDESSGSDTSGGSAIDLVPADTTDGGTDVVSLEETGDHLAPVTPSKEDTVITPAGVSVFDEDELAGLDADPMAKTQIAPSVTDELSIEGGSGGKSGLLDMTRDSDDTSLGAELLDEIYSGEETQPSKAIPGAESGGGVEGGAEPAEAFDEVEEPAAPVQRMMTVQVVDPLAGVFTGFLVAAAILLGFAGMVAAGLNAGVLPGFVGWLSSNLLYWIIIAFVVTGAGAGVGYLLSKRLAA